ncbi:MAG: hypothetical protein L3J58_10430 [Emcibacter sp.]|nr:hypothetical protein [Emcibacter sp.]
MAQFLPAKNDDKIKKAEFLQEIYAGFVLVINIRPPATIRVSGYISRI